MLFKRLYRMKSAAPIISFTFDDFPESALSVGGSVLEQAGVYGTFYTSLGLLSEQGPSGAMFGLSDLRYIIDRGHELGCHTFSHCHSWDTPTAIYMDAIHQNRARLQALIPDASFKTFSYPISPPRPRTKQGAGSQFSCCRGGGQTFNCGTVDLNYLSAFFLEKCKDNMESVKQIVELNRLARGWLIFATHDVSDRPGPFGCRTRYFEAVVRHAVDSGAVILPVFRALNLLRSFDSLVEEGT